MKPSTATRIRTVCNDFEKRIKREYDNKPWIIMPIDHRWTRNYNILNHIKYIQFWLPIHRLDGNIIQYAFFRFLELKTPQ